MVYVTSWEEFSKNVQDLYELDSVNVSERNISN